MSGARYVVAPQDPPTLAALLPRLGDGAEGALREGRVFVGRERGREATPLRAGDVVVVHPPRAASSELVVLHADRELVVVDKPAELPTIADHRGDLSLAALVAARYGEGVHATSRLDVGVSGVVVFARTKRARAALSDARDEATYDRLYLAVARGDATALAPSWDEPIGRGDDPRRRRVAGRDAVDAKTEPHALAVAGGHVLLALRPHTGRTHQLRVHAAHHGLPLVGDKPYGGPTRVVGATGAVLPFARIALHAHRVSVLGRRFVSPVPPELRALWSALGGDDAAWGAVP